MARTKSSMAAVAAALKETLESSGLEAALRRLGQYLEKYGPVRCLRCVLYRKDIGMYQFVAEVDMKMPVDADSRRMPFFRKENEYPDVLSAQNIISQDSHFSFDEERMAGIGSRYDVDRFYAERFLMRHVLYEDSGSMCILILRTDDSVFFKDETVQDISGVTRELAVALKDTLRLKPAGGERDPLELLKSCPDLNAQVRQILSLSRSAASVLVTGETGVGKELVAASLHRTSRNAGGPFVPLNCGAIPESLMDSAFFGYEKGAFSGAIGRYEGFFEQANGGTLFLDEIGDMAPVAQIRLLRVLEEKKIRRIGGKSLIPVNVRVIAATNRDVGHFSEDGGFRPDLLYRLNTFSIHIPPLRERKNDIIPLSYYFLNSLAGEYEVKSLPGITPRDIDRLISYGWPGNIRELKSVLERGFVRWLSGSPRKNIEIVLPAENAKQVQQNAGTEKEQDGQDGFLTLDEMTQMYVRKALELCGGRIYGKKGAAYLLKMHPNTLKSYVTRHRLA